MIATSAGTSILLAGLLTMFVAACCLLALVMLLLSISWILDNWAKIQEAVWGDDEEGEPSEGACCGDPGSVGCDCATPPESGSYELDVIPKRACPHKKIGIIAAVTVITVGIAVALKQLRSR